MTKRTFTDIADSIGDAKAAGSDAETRRLLGTIQLELDSMAGDSEDDGIHYLRGYAWFLHSDLMISASIQSTVEASLATSIRLNPTNPWAHYILALHFYDLEQLENALLHTSQDFVDQLPFYDAFRLAEVELCCRIRMSGVSACRELIDAYVTLCSLGVREDQTHFSLVRVFRGIARSPKAATLQLIRAQLLKLDEFAHMHEFAELLGTEEP